MDASFHPDHGNGLGADESRSVRRGNHSAAPSFDGLETRELLSVAHPPLKAVRAAHQAQIRARHDRQAAHAASANPLAHLTTASPIPPLPTTSSLGVSGFSPIGRVMGARRRIGLTIQPPVIPPHVLAAQTPASRTSTPQAASPQNTTVITTGGNNPVNTAPAVSGVQYDRDIQTASDRFKADFLSIAGDSKVTPALLTALRGSYQAIENAATGPADPAKIQALQADLDALGNALPTVLQSARIKLDIAAVVESRGVTDSNLINKAVADADAVLAASNLTDDKLKLLAGDVQTLQSALDAKQNAPKVESVLVTTSIVTTTSTTSAPTTSTPAPKLAGTLLASLHGPILGTATADSIRHTPEAPVIDTAGPTVQPPYGALLKLRPATAGAGTATEKSTQGDPRPVLTLDRVHALTT